MKPLATFLVGLLCWSAIPFVFLRDVFAAFRDVPSNRDPL